MTDSQKQQLKQQLWNIANDLRGKMTADEFRDYCLGFIFYKYLSERMHKHANEILSEDGIDFLSIDEVAEDGEEMLEAIKEDSITQLGYFLKPSELFSTLAKRGKDKEFILQDLANVLKSIEKSTMGTESEDDFDQLFEELDLSASKLGKTEAAKNTLIAKVLAHLDKIDFCLDDAESDILGDAYEYLIGQFASGAGKKAGEFYTPAQVSTILARIVTTGKDRIKAVYDPTCGSGSLLLRVSREAEVGDYYGQEMTRTTFNLARMNMLLHGVHYRNFDIKHEDTLEHPQHIDMRFEAIVANPPFSAKWSANPLHLSDDRFSQYGKLAPSSKADFAFVQHMLYQLDDSGTMAVILPHGALFRGAAEGHIRKYLIEDRNWLDAVIGLPANIFYGTSISTCILIFKKCRENPEDILFIDASNHFEKAKNQNILRRKDIDKIVATYRSRKVEDKYSHIAPISEVVANEYNINIPRYVDTFEEEELVNIEQTANNLIEMQKSFNEIDNELNPLCLELNIPSPVGCNLHLLQTYKRGLMQKIFSQEVRFKADDGSAFPNWNEKYLGDISEVLRGGGLSKSSLSENGKFKCLLYGELFRKHGAVIVNVDNRTNVNEGLSSRSGDILMPTSDVTPYGLATASVIMLDDVRLGGDINVVRLREGYDCMFISYLLNYMKKEIIRLVTGTTIKHIYARDIKGLALNIPKDVLEQRRISRIFSLLDKKKDLIDSENSTIEPANKSLQQKTFI